MDDQRSTIAVLYAAKSTVDSKGSNETQLIDARTFAEREGLEVIATYADENESAFHGNRGPELAAALDHAERIGGSIVVQHSDRLARGDGVQARHLVQLVFEAKRRGISLRSVEDDSSLESVLMAAAMGERNTEDSRRKSAAIKAGLARRRASGRRTGGQTYGLTWRRNEDDERETVPEPAQAAIVERIYAEYLAGRNILQIVKALNGDRIRASRGGKWKPAVISSVLANPLYAGLVRDGEKLIEAQHEAIIDRRRWEEAQALRKAKAQTHRTGRSTLGQHLFRKGFLRCGECGAAMVPRTERNKDGSLRETYRCYGRYTDPAHCSMQQQPRAPIDSAVYAYFEQVGLDVEATRDQLAAATERKVAEVSALLDVAKREASAAAARLSRVKRDYAAGELSAAEWREFRDELQPDAEAAVAERDRLSAQLAEVKTGPKLEGLEDDVLQQLADIRAAIAGEVTSAAGVEGVRATLLRLFDRFVLHHGQPKAAHLELIGEEYWIEPMINKRAVAGYDEKLRPVLERKPLDQAGKNGSSGLVLLNPVISPISAYE
jgi:DNA invertase Pin-like site-specific DNA recombinase